MSRTPVAAAPAASDLFDLTAPAENLGSTNFEGASTRSAVGVDLASDEFAPATSEFLSSIETSAKRYQPISDERANELADKISESLWNWFDDEEAVFKSLELLSPEDVMRVDQAFAERHGKDWELGGLRELFIDQMSGANLDRGLDLLEGFNPDRMARLVHESGYGLFDMYNISERIKGLSTEQFQEMSNSFERHYGQSLASFLDGELWDYQVSNVIEQVYGKEAVEVANLIHAKLGDGAYSEASFIIASLSPEARQLVEEAYQAQHNVSLDQEKEQLTAAQRNIVESSAENSPLAIEIIKLRQALGFWSFNPTAVNELLANRSEGDMYEIRRAYQAVFGENILETCQKRYSTKEYAKVADMILRPGSDQIA